MNGNNFSPVTSGLAAATVVVEEIGLLYVHEAK